MRGKRRAEERAARAADKVAKEETKRAEELRSYKSIMRVRDRCCGCGCVDVGHVALTPGPCAAGPRACSCAGGEHGVISGDAHQVRERGGGGGRLHVMRGDGALPRDGHSAWGRRDGCVCHIPSCSQTQCSDDSALKTLLNRFFKEFRRASRCSTVQPRQQPPAPKWRPPASPLPSPAATCDPGDQRMPPHLLSTPIASTAAHAAAATTGALPLRQHFSTSHLCMPLLCLLLHQRGVGLLQRPLGAPVH